VGTASNVWKILITFCSFLVKIPTSLRFQQRAGAYGKRKITNTCTTMGKGYIKLDK